MTSEQPTVSTPWRSDPAVMSERIEKWWTEHVAPGATVGDVTAPEGSGMSSETLLFTVQTADGADERYVAPLAPLPSPQFQAFPEYDLALQRRVMETVAEHTEVPVPHVVAHERDPEWLGSPVLLMRRGGGIVPSDVPPYTMAGWLFDAALDDRRTLEREAVRVLARLHEHPGAARSHVPRPPAVRRRRARPAPRVPTLVLRLGAGGTARSAHRADLGRARPDSPGGRADRPQLGRQRDRQQDVPRLQAGRGARLGDGGARTGGDRRRLDDLPPPILRGHDAQVRHALPRRLPPARAGRRALRGGIRPPSARPRVVRDVRRATLRDRFDPHHVANGRVRRRRAAGRPRRRHHVPQPARGDGR